MYVLCTAVVFVLVKRDHVSLGYPGCGSVGGIGLPSRPRLVSLVYFSVLHSSALLANSFVSQQKRATHVAERLDAPAFVCGSVTCHALGR